MLSTEKVGNKLQLQCDNCACLFERYAKKRVLLQERHYCCRQCQHSSLKNGLAREATKRTCIEKLGASSPFAAVECREKARQTLLRNYGVEHQMQSQLVKQRIQDTNLSRYGVENVFAAEPIKEKIRNTMLDRYGVEYALQSDEIRDKFILTCLSHHNTTSPLASSEVQQKIKQTNVRKYGVEHVSQFTLVKENKKRAFMKKHGVEHVLQLPSVRERCNSEAAWTKRVETMKKRGSFQSSNAERVFMDVCQTLNVVVETQVKVSKEHKWIVDFYLKDLDIYVQIDGVYWHGLDRPIEKIKEFKNKRDVVIYKKWLTDKQQNEWFEQNNLKLIRITDKEIKSWQQKEKLLQQIQIKLRMKLKTSQGS